jgi:glycosyltransferase involved in cell wall biosynthesis
MTGSNEISFEIFTSQSPHLNVSLVTETFIPEVNGVAMTLGKLMHGLVNRGHCVQVIRPRQSVSDKPSEQTGLSEYLVGGIAIPFYRDLRFGWPAQHYLKTLWKKKRPDVVHVATEGPLGWSAVMAARKLGIPIISSYHTNFHKYSSHYGIGWLKKSIANYLLKFHNLTMATLVPTRALAESLKSSGYHHVSIMSRGVDLAKFTPDRRSRSLRDSWGVNEQDLVLLYVGRLAKEKNIYQVLESFVEIKKKLPSTKLVFVGDGPLRKTLQNLCPEAIFAGTQIGNELATYYASGDIFLFPSLTETFGNVVPEAMASGLGVVSYDYAAASNLIVHNDNGVLVDLKKPSSFVKSALALACDRDKLNSIRELVAESVAHLEWDEVCDCFEYALIAASYGNHSHFKSAIQKLNIAQNLKNSSLVMIKKPLSLSSRTL